MANYLEDCGSRFGEGEPEAPLPDDVTPPAQPDDIPPTQPDPDDVIPPTQPSPKKTPEAKLGIKGKPVVSPTVQELMDTQVGVGKKIVYAYRLIFK